MINRMLLFSLLILISGVACSSPSQESAYLEEANALCDAHNPTTWKEVDFKTLSPVERAKMFSQKIQAAIHSDKMKEIFQQLIKDPPDQAYANYVKNVSAIVGKKYECSYIKDYFGAIPQ